MREPEKLGLEPGLPLSIKKILEELIYLALQMVGSYLDMIWNFARNPNWKE
jgi:hypothetical protein